MDTNEDDWVRHQLSDVTTEAFLAHLKLLRSTVARLREVVLGTLRPDLRAAQPRETGVR